MTRNHLSLCCLLLLTGLLSGCSSISKGITEAFLERETEDTRQCWISGREFAGLDSLYEAGTSEDVGTDSPSLLKVLKVHGIGDHKPGYSHRLLSGLLAEQGFESRDETIKTIHLSHPLYPNDLGILRIHRFMNIERAQEMLYYELTWDSVLAEEKELLDFDDSVEASRFRTDFNHRLKTFINETVPDALMYNTKYREAIQLSVTQATCWMLSERWDGLPNNRGATCTSDSDNYWSDFDASSIVIISHSLGSRISIDALQSSVSWASERPDFEAMTQKLQSKPIHLYMLSNQLPLLQLGQPLPEIHDQVKSYCSPEGDRYDERFFESLNIVAFSDPNDMFSYTVSPDYIDRYVDSRLCPQVTNVLIQVAPVTSFLGLTEVAGPRAAHSDYEIDSRVLKMLVSGFGQSHGQDEVKERCEFLETVPDY